MRSDWIDATPAGQTRAPEVVAGSEPWVDVQERAHETAALRARGANHRDHFLLWHSRCLLVIGGQMVRAATPALSIPDRSVKRTILAATGLRRQRFVVAAPPGYHRWIMKPMIAEPHAGQSGQQRRPSLPAGRDDLR